MPSLVLLNKTDYLLPQAVEFLTKGWAGGLLDLSGMLIVLPTQEARRRLHEALTRWASLRETALLPPHWRLPMQFLEGSRTDLVAPSLEQLLWLEVIQGMREDESRRLFPRKTPQLDAALATELFESIRSLRGELSQAGLWLTDAGALRRDDPRWNALIALESRYLQRLSERGVIDRITAQLEGVRHPVLANLHHRTQGVTHLVIAGVPDLPKVYEAILPRLETQGIAVSILTHDPMGLGREAFDHLGRPTETWEHKPLSIPEEIIHLCLDRSEEMEKAALLAKTSGGHGRSCAIGVSSVTLAKPLQNALTALDLPCFNPAGEPLDTLPLGRLLRDLAKQLGENSVSSTLQLLRHPAIMHWLDLNPALDFTTLDQLSSHLLPSSLDDLLARFPDRKIDRITISESLHGSLLNLQHLLATLRSGRGIAPILTALQTIYQAVDLAQSAGGRESVEQLQSWIQEAEEVITAIPCLDLLTLLTGHLQSGSATGEKPRDAIEIAGWLELLWEDAPHLIVTGLNDGLVPENRRDDPFLHEGVRRAWGLASESTRLCRDSYLLLCLMAARHKKGRLDLLLSQHDETGAVLKPSRLLLRPGNEMELPSRVLNLFRELPPRPSQQWQAGWALKPEQQADFSSLSASLLRDYLACPARFYLKHVVNLRKSSFGLEELDPAGFGTLLHRTLRDFGNDPSLKNLSKTEEIERALILLWKKLFAVQFGSQLSFPLLYQHEAGIRRLRGAAKAQASLRAEGWEIMACESSFTGFPLAGVNLRGQIDRIDRRVTESGTEWRIIDYKSSGKSIAPQSAHYTTLKRDQQALFSAYECFNLGTKEYHWTDLQLPLYQMILLADMKADTPSLLGLEGLSKGPVEVGYFSLPGKVNESCFLPFERIEELEQSAFDCLKGVITSIREGIFWPPRMLKYDDFEGLHFDHFQSMKSSGQQTFDPARLISKSLQEASS
jgi:ATP-dependent helicase/nuclease subunit B